jgi:hypothetical protein
VDAEGEDVSLTPEWCEALERARVEGEELDDNRLQAEKAERRKLERREYFDKVRRGEIPKADRTPKLRGKAATVEILDRHRPRWKREESEKLRPMVEPAKVFILDRFEGFGRIRLGLLEDMWLERGGQKWHLRLALRELRFKAKRLPEHPGEWFVYPPAGGIEKPTEPEPAAVVPMHKPTEPVEAKPPPSTAHTLPPKVDGIYHHGQECTCWLCGAEDAS